ncbi:CCA tRNA nucleotidyltransferase [Bacillaceae bacterium ZC4]|jgi:tRNA nucleotidyltransferase (CCA-adding enzyme)|uniref:CCA tRNA nucleotidyltransferase n=1 Tax=Aeribacillus TaxID=1055323 RepID=UPI001023E554|nr:CCA tRNA nucleotidyltransferase [Aeribacillus pallidus]AXI39990.1 CCA tRNA nucleotidyltransferase [Bacillaceae bacterium ZC4]RZI53076.1 CCA tRNA nucleotidyltransferase [Aeribacillus pallidus]BBU39983.1 CCA-adding enzyme [Aeribacillus pallidus]
MKAEFVEAIPIIEQLNEHGHEAYFVGGSVRDLLLNRKIGDIDIATSAKPDEIQKIFPKTIDVGVQHGTVIVLHNGKPYEVTTFRTEGEYEEYRRPKYVRFVSSLQEDLKRRDFTINALAMDKNGRILDYVNGMEDLENRMIRTVGDPYERFSEDALRMLRALRFVSQLSFRLEEKTLQAITVWHKLLQNISIERITAEFEKLLAGASANDAIQLLTLTNVYQHMPGLKQKKEQLNKLLRYPMHNLCKREEYWTVLLFVLETDDGESFMRNWKLPRRVIKKVCRHLELLNCLFEKDWTAFLLYKTGLEDALQLERIRQVLQKEKNEEAIQKLQKSYEQLPIHSRKELAVTGNDILNIVPKKPGKWVEEYLTLVEQQVVNGLIENNSGEIKEWLKNCNQKLGESC